MDATDLFDNVLPQFFPAHWLDSPGIAFSEFPSRIRIGYVIRGDGNYRYVLDVNLSETGVTIRELHNAALVNLDKLETASISIAKVPGGYEGWIASTNDNFAAVRILLPGVQSIFREELGDGFLISLPHRDDCFCWSRMQSADQQAEHRQRVLRDFVQVDYNLTPDIMTIEDGCFKLVQAQAVPSSDL